MKFVLIFGKTFWSKDCRFTEEISWSLSNQFISDSLLKFNLLWRAVFTYVTLSVAYYLYINDAPPGQKYEVDCKLFCKHKTVKYSCINQVSSVDKLILRSVHTIQFSSTWFTSDGRFIVYLLKMYIGSILTKANHYYFIVMRKWLGSDKIGRGEQSFKQAWNRYLNFLTINILRGIFSAVVKEKLFSTLFLFTCLAIMYCNDIVIFYGFACNYQQTTAFTKM